MSGYAERLGARVFRLKDSFDILARHGEAFAEAHADGARFLLLFGAPDIRRCASALQPPFDISIEIGAHGSPPELDVYQRAFLTGGVLTDLTTRTAYLHETSMLFSLGLAQRLSMDPQIEEAVQLTVQEAVANALIHGNLNIDSGLRTSLEGFREFNRLIQERLVDDTFANRRVTFAASWDEHYIELSVGDQGEGYMPSLTGEAAMTDKTGRGLGYIRDNTLGMTVTRGGRRLTMRFSLIPPDRQSGADPQETGPKL